MTLASLAGLDTLTQNDCAELVSLLRSASYTKSLVAEADGFYPEVLRPARLPIVRWWLERRPDPGAKLARLFAYDDALADEAAASALGRDLFERLLQAGVLGPAPGGGVKARFLLAPTVGELYVLSDRLEDGPDAVMGPGGGTERLARLVPENLSGSALDLGCGAGTLALVAARRGARRSLGLDVNPRAIELASFNARLNALTVELRAGDGLAPARNERFDLLVSQPPFVAKPPSGEERTFLYGGDVGDELPLRFMREAPRVLAPGGRAIFLLQAAEREGDPLMARIKRNLEKPLPHVLVLSGPGPIPATQAAVFGALEDPSFGEGYARAARRYLDHFESMGVRTFGGAIVVLSNPKPELAGGRYALAMTLRNPPEDAAALELYLRSLDLHEAPDERLDAARFRLSPHARVTRELASDEDEAGGGEVAVVVRIAPPGIGSDFRLSAGELRVLAGIDASNRLAEVLDALSRAAPGHATLRDELRSFVRSALLHGALVPG